MNTLQNFEKEQIEKLGRTVPEFGPGDTLRVNVKVIEGTRERVQAYEGVCIARSGGGLNESFTVRKISNGVGVERIFPLHSPMLAEIKVVRRGRVRRAKLFYLRNVAPKEVKTLDIYQGGLPFIGLQLLVLVLTYLLQEPIMEFVRNFRF